MEIRVNRTMTTDADGRYEFSGLPAGRYSMTVARNGYVTLQFGQQRPFEPGRPLELADAQFMERIDFSLPRGSVIAGRITDELGEPMAGVRMTASRYRYLPSGERQLSPFNPGGMFNIVTNDLGEFRIFGLMPGTYLVSADPDDGGFISTPTGILPPGPSSGDSDGYATTYYPGTLSADDAQTVTVGLAEVAIAIFPLTLVRMAKVSGTFVTQAVVPQQERASYCGRGTDSAAFTADSRHRDRMARSRSQTSRRVTTSSKRSLAAICGRMRSSSRPDRLRSLLQGVTFPIWSSR